MRRVIGAFVVGENLFDVKDYQYEGNQDYKDTICCAGQSGYLWFPHISRCVTSIGTLSDIVGKPVNAAVCQSRQLDAFGFYIWNIEIFIAFS